MTELSNAGWPWRSLLDARRPKPPRAYAVPGLLPLPSLSILFGAPGTLKTMLAMDLALCVAAGHPWLSPEQGEPPFAANGIGLPVLWIDVDNGADRLERRLDAIAAGHEIPDAPLDYLSFPKEPPFVATDLLALNRLTDDIERTGSRLVVLDNLGAISGNADENSAAMIAVMRGLRDVSEQGHCAVLAIHHKSKGTRARAGDSLRGHSSIEAAVDLALLVERREGSDTIALHSTKTRDRPIPRLTAQWTYTADPHDPIELLSGRFYGTGSTPNRPQPRSELAAAYILEALGDGHEYGQSEMARLVRAATGIGRNATLAGLASLKERGQIATRNGHGLNSIVYFRPTPP